MPGPGGEVLWVTPAAVVHEMPSMRLQLTLASAGATRAELGRYVLEHSALTPPHDISLVAPVSSCGPIWEAKSETVDVLRLLLSAPVGSRPNGARRNPLVNVRIP